MTTFKIGDSVRCERQRPARGSWKQFAGKVGTVAVLNRDDGEIGVQLTPGRNTWFRPDELVLVSRHSLLKAPRSASEASR